MLAKLCREAADRWRQRRFNKAYAILKKETHDCKRCRWRKLEGGKRICRKYDFELTETMEVIGKCGGFEK